MRTRSFRKLVSLLLISCLLTGCATNPTLTYLGEAQLRDYRTDAERISFPDACEVPPEEATFASPPRNIRDRNRDEIWEMSLAEAIHLCLLHNKIIRNSARTSTGAIVSGSASGTNFTSIVRAPSAVASVYDPAIQETGVLFGTRGVEAALSAFDAQFTSSMIWGRNELIQNNQFLAGNLADGAVLQSDTAAFQAQLSKTQADGGQISLSHDVNYLYNNAASNLFPSVYTGNIQLAYRRPLWAGGGTEFTRIAGPASSNIQGLSGVAQGVVIARINNDITIADFEMQVRNMVREVEDVYWNLYLAYRRFDTEVVARNSALRTWREVHTKYIIGTAGGNAADEAQAEEQYHDAKSRAEDELNNVYSMELELRRMLGLSVNDGRIIRPSDEPITAEFKPDWYVALAEALTRRTELRRQKWNIKSLSLQLRAAENLVNPRLDVVGAYNVNMFGNNLFSQSDDDVMGRNLNSAYETLTQGNQTGWQLGIQAAMPIGFRSARTQVRNLELRLAQARELLKTQEVDISHELADGFQALNRNYQLAQTRFNQGRAAQRQLKAFEAEYEVGTKTLDLLLQAQTRLARAQIQYYTSIIEYTKSITNIQFRKGTLLEYNSIHLGEGGWSPKAYEDALKRAWARSHAFDNDLIHAEPEPFVNHGRVMGTVEMGSPNGMVPPIAGPQTNSGIGSDSSGIVPPAPPAVDGGETEFVVPEQPGTIDTPMPNGTPGYDDDVTPPGDSGFAPPKTEAELNAELESEGQRIEEGDIQFEDPLDGGGGF